MSEQRFLLCRPQGGLNDALNQLQVCLDYAERWGRVVLLDVRGLGLLEKVFDYLEILEEGRRRLVLASKSEVSRLNELGTFPAEVQGRLETYEAQFDDIEGFVDVTTRARLTFDFTKDHKEQVLLHHHWGGGTESLRAIRLFRIRPEFRSEIEPLPQLQGKRFGAAHIRHSDYTTDYRWFLKRISRKIPGGRLFVLTDSSEVLKFADSLAHVEVFHSDVSSEVSGRPIHARNSGLSDESLAHEAKRLLSELLTVGMAETFFYSYVRGFPPVKDRYLISGFTKLCIEFFLHPELGQEFGNINYLAPSVGVNTRRVVAIRKLEQILFVAPTVLFRRGKSLISKLKYRR